MTSASTRTVATVTALLTAQRGEAGVSQAELLEGADAAEVISLLAALAVSLLNACPGGGGEIVRDLGRLGARS